MRGSVPAVNGRPRRSLTEEIDRLEAILDGLADALNGAVADAVKDAVGAAAKEAMAEAAPAHLPVTECRGAQHPPVVNRLVEGSAAVFAEAARVVGFAARITARGPKAGLVAAGAGTAAAVVCWAVPPALADLAVGGVVAVLAATTAGTRALWETTPPSGGPTRV